MDKDLRVLLVEDSAADAELVVHKLYEAGYQFVYELVDNARDTRRALDEKQWDVILCDYSMPGLDPYRILDILRETEKDIPLIVISGTIGEDNAIKLIKAGCQDCIMKSNLRRLPDIINREMKEAIVREENRLLNMKMQKYQILCDAANDMMLFIDDTGNILDVNSAAIKCYGYCHEEFLTKNVLDLRHISNKELVNKQMQTAIAGSIVFEAIHYRKDNTSFLAEVSSQGILLHGQRILFSIVRDITERKQNEGQREQVMKDMLESQRIAHIGTWRLNVETNQVVWSDELYRMYGFDPSIPPPPYTEHMKLFTPESWEKLSTALELTRTSGIPYELEMKTIRTDGSNGWMWVRGEADQDARGNIIALWGAAQDITDRKRAEEALADSQAFLQAAFETSQAGIVIADAPDGKLRYVNKAGLLLWGQSEEQIVKNVDLHKYAASTNILHFDGTPYRDDEVPLSRAILYGETCSEELIIRRDNFEDRIVLAKAAPIKDDEGNIKAGIVVFLDITEKKQDEKNIQRQNETFSSLLKVLPVGVFMVDAIDGKPIVANDMAKELLGRGILSDANRNNLAEVYKTHKKGCGGSYPTEEMPIIEGMKGKNSYIDDMVVERPDGTEVLLEIFGTPITDEKGKPWASLVTFLDITERTKVLDDLEVALKFSEDIINSANNGIIVYDTELRYKIWNPYMEKLSGVSSKGVLGRKMEDVFPWLMENGVVHDLQMALKGKRLDDHDFHFDISETGEIVWVRENSGPLFNRKGDIVGVLVLVQDISERKKVEDLIRESEEKYRLLYTSMSQGLALHEIITDDDGKPVDYVFLDINDSYTRLLGVTREMCIGKKITEVMPKVEKYWIDFFGKVALTGESDYYENYLETTGGYYSTYTYSPKKRQFAVIVSDITEQRKNQEKLLYMSYHDHLTGLYNRRFFEQELNRLDAISSLPLTIIMGDVNGLKIINDSFGHAVGDDYLNKTAEIIKKACRVDDIIARFGGDEFVAILPNADTSEAIRVIERMKDMISGTNIGAIELSVSFGFATKDNIQHSVFETVASAENHMYTHKTYERASMRSKTIDLIMNALFEKSDRELQHSNRVSSICEAIATNMNFKKDDVNQIRIAGLVHDIGKIGIKEGILNKAGSLDQDEWAEMKRHPEAGWRILSTTIEFSEVSEFVLRHHEKWDGSGYPNRLKGEEIPIEARIIAVADAYDAMTSERSYKSAYGRDEAVYELKRCSGTQFDPEIVEVFVNHVIPNNSNFR
jgi:diguanylate cyclase (GGDEF)-like protein/PAS domain S-box-containing protein